MPTKKYMQRQERHDHGFTLPVPELTKEFAVPNACNRCHTDQTRDWPSEELRRDETVVPGLFQFLSADGVAPDPRPRTGGRLGE